MRALKLVEENGDHGFKQIKGPVVEVYLETDSKKMAEFSERVTKRAIEHYAERTGKSIEEAKEMAEYLI